MNAGPKSRQPRLVNDLCSLLPRSASPYRIAVVRLGRRVYWPPHCTSPEISRLVIRLIHPPNAHRRASEAFHNSRPRSQPTNILPGARCLNQSHTHESAAKTSNRGRGREESVLTCYCLTTRTSRVEGSELIRFQAPETLRTRPGLQPTEPKAVLENREFRPFGFDSFLEAQKRESVRAKAISEQAPIKINATTIFIGILLHLSAFQIGENCRRNFQSDSGLTRNTRERGYRCSVPGLAGFTGPTLCGARSLMTH